MHKTTCLVPSGDPRGFAAVFPHSLGWVLACSHVTTKWKAIVRIKSSTCPHRSWMNSGVFIGPVGLMTTLLHTEIQQPIAVPSSFGGFCRFCPPRSPEVTPYGVAPLSA